MKHNAMAVLLAITDLPNFLPVLKTALWKPGAFPEKRL
jgi:hypothetical protein